MNKKEGFISILKKIGVFLILLTGIMSFLTEFYSIYGEELIFMALSITFLIIFIWKNIIEKMINKWL